MNLKRFAIRGLVVLAIAVALCMFFARTVLRITTPQVSLADAQTGRLDQRIGLTAKLYFPNPEPVYLQEAAQYSVVVMRLYVKPGFPVKEGDLLFTTSMPDYQSKMDDLVKSYDAEVVKLMKLEGENRRSRERKSPQNELYEQTLASQIQLAEARTSARARALSAGIDLPDGIAQWNAAVAGADEAVRDAVARAVAKSAAHDELTERFYKSYDDSKLRVSGDLFKYIQDREEHYKEMGKIEAQMTQLEAAMLSLHEIRAAREGYVIEVNIQEGDVYDGKKAAYSMNNLEKPPVLRADASGTDRVIEKGTKATVRADRSEWNSTVLDVGIDMEGRRYADLEIREEELRYSGGLYAMVLQRDATYTAYITQRAANSATLIPAGALHSEGAEAYIFVVERNYWRSGITDESMKIRKMTVTVLDKSDRLVAIAEELWGVQIAYREDRPLTDGATVMEYLN